LAEEDAMASGEPEQFDKTLRREVVRYASRYNYPEDYGRGFEGYLAHLFVQEYGFREHLDGLGPADSELDLSDRLIRSDDLGVDICLEDSQNKQLLLVQAKWDGGKSYPLEDEVIRFFSIHDRLMDPSYIATGGDHAVRLLGDYREKVNDGYTVRLRFVSNRPITGSRREKFDIGMKVEQENYETAHKRVVCELTDKSGLKNLLTQIRQAEEGILPEVSFKLQDDAAVEFTDPRHFMIGRISGNELRDLYLNKDYSQRLFALNIRLPMTLQRQTNRQIQKTASTDPEDFFFFNNGVSAVCESFDYNSAKNTVTANRFQIINGAQTIGAIANPDVDCADLFVLFRLSSTKEATGGTFTDQIIEFNNTQNPTIASDFRANDPIQKFLQVELTKLSGRGPAPTFQYIPKRGAKRSGKGGAALTPEELGRVRYAFIHEPCMSYREPRRFFDRGDHGLYSAAFGVDGVLAEVWDPETLAEAVVALTIEHRVKELGKEIKKEDRDKVEEDRRSEGKFLSRLARYVVALVGVGLRSVQGKTFHSYTEILANAPRFNEVVEPHLTIARRLLREEWRRRANEGHVQTEYSLAGSSSTWTELSNAMKEEVGAEIF
jgi:hypothetical protein